MENETHKINRDGWSKGPWDLESDKYEWRDKETGLPCLIVRSNSGALCGYVGIPPGHEYHGKSYNDCLGDVHGGLTYSGKCSGAVCHIAKPGEPEDVWWLGFDCAHYYDTIPGINYTISGSSYRTVEYVRNECANLAQQITRVKA